MTGPTTPPTTLADELQACVPAAGPLRAYLDWAVKTTDAEHLFHVGSILPCWAHEACVRGFRIDSQQRHVPKLWTFLVGVSASSKSTAMKRATSLYRGHTSKAGMLDPFLIAEGSVPGIFEAMAERFDVELDMTPGILYRDEAARLLDTTDSIADMLCNVIDGEDVKRHLRGARAANAQAAGSVKDTLVRPAFSGLLTTTFSRLREVTKSSYLEGGLYSRFLWFAGSPRLPEQSLFVDLHLAEAQRVAELWGDWAGWALAQQTLGRQLVVEVPRHVIELLRSTLFATLVQHGTRDDRLNATRKRGLHQAIMVAALYALNDRRLEVVEEDMDRAINLIEFCLRGLERLDASLAVDDLMVAADQAFHVIASAGPHGVARSRLYPALRKSKWWVDQIIDTLLAEGSVRTVARATGKPGRPPTNLVACGPHRYAGEPADEQDELPPNVVRFTRPTPPPASSDDA